MTNITTALGKWPNAPLAMVVAQVRFDPSPETEHALLIERVHAAFPGEFPNAAEVRQFSFVVDGSGVQAPAAAPVVLGHDLRSADGLRCIRLQNGALTYNTSSYQDSVHFVGEWRRLMEALCAGGEIQASRLGLRYVDFIIPSAGRAPEDYLLDGFGRSPAAMGEQSPIAFVMYDYERPEGGRLRVQYGRGFGPPDLPPDLLDAAPPAGFLVSKYRGGVSAVLDMDRWRPASARMSPAVLAEEFHILRQDIAASFRRIISPLAEQEWQGGKV